MTKPIVVIGAGICGVSSAIWLLRMGHQVVLIDKAEPGSGASFGNAGLLAPWSADPVSAPTLWRDALPFLINPDGPLFIKWLALPGMMPWLVRFMSNATDRKTRSIMHALIPILGDAVDQHRMLVRATPMEKWVLDSKISFAYPTQKSFQKDHYSWEMKALAGLKPNVITGKAVREEEPILGPTIECLAVLEGQGHIADPGGYVAGLAEYFEAEGGKVVRAEVKDFQLVSGRISQIETDQGVFECSNAVITAGIWSKDLMKKLGLKIPMLAERGYHVLFENPSEVPRNPMLMTAGKFGVNPMDMGLRCAGTVELGHHKSAASNAPIKMLRRRVAQAFPNMTYSGTREWMGCRPTPPDSVPLIGEIANTGIFTGFGHQHIGLTAGPKTGRLLAQLISADRPNIDMSPYDPARYLAGRSPTDQ